MRGSALRRRLSPFSEMNASYATSFRQGREPVEGADAGWIGFVEFVKAYPQRRRTRGARMQLGWARVRRQGRRKRKKWYQVLAVRGRRQAHREKAGGLHRRLELDARQFKLAAPNLLTPPRA